jgi:F-type H+-transporting ATPase subunit gamma
MTDSAANLQRKIGSAGDLQSVVRTMKTMAASSIGQYESAVRSLEDYYRTVQLGLAACLRPVAPSAADDKADLADAANTTDTAEPAPPRTNQTGRIGAVVFGSDQGLVGQFNDAMCDFVIATLQTKPGQKTVWAVGERIAARLAETDLPAGQSFVLPSAIGAITPLVGEILTTLETLREQGTLAEVYLFYHRPHPGSIYTPVCQRLLPLDHVWRRELTAIRWPTKNLPEVMPNRNATLRALVREYLFVSLFRACAESLASENASRLSAMQRAEKNIDELLDDLNRNYHRLRQSSIDEELFDVVAGFEALLK